MTDDQTLDTQPLSRQVMQRCEILAALSEEPERLMRTFLCPPMHAVHDVLSEWMMAAGMRVRIDGAGNCIGHFPALTENAPVLLFGSHLDTVPNAGKYDGALGILLALAAVEALGGRRLPFAVEVVGFSEEEGVRFGVPYLGSLALAGGLTPDILDRQDTEGASVADAIRDYGLDPDEVPAARYEVERILGYVEAHIEQGPVLEDLGLSLGVVDAIAGQTRVRIAYTGHAGHAGTTPMAGRRDALVAAAECVVAAERLGLATPGLVATVGQIEAWPGASNVIPGTAMLSLDVRHARDTVQEMAVTTLRSEFEAIGQRRGLTCHWVEVSHQSAVPMESGLSGLLAQSVAAAGLPVHRMVSGAGHDAAIMGKVVPAAMLFLRSPGGLSHHPDENVLPEDVEAALRALLVMIRLLEEKYAMRNNP